MSRTPADATTDRGQRLPIAYWIQPRADGTLAVILEMIEGLSDALLSPVHRKVLDEYKAVRRAVRAHNQKFRAASPR